MAKELEKKRGRVETVDPSDASQEFLEKDPEDRKNRKVRHTNKYLDIDTRNAIRREIEEVLDERAKKDKE